MVYAIFNRDRPRGGKRLMHAAREGASETLCKHAIGIGSGLVRDGNYWNNHPCPRCWNAAQNQPASGSSEHRQSRLTLPRNRALLPLVKQPGREQVPPPPVTEIRKPRPV